MLFVAVMSFAAIGVGFFLYQYGPETLHIKLLGSDRSGGIAYTIVGEGVYAVGVDQTANYRITNHEELLQLWTLVYGNGGEVPALPHVDFKTEEILAIFDGTHSSGGYGVTVTKVSDAGGKRTISIMRTRPGDSCTPTLNITSPFQILIIKKSTLPLDHTDQIVTTVC